MAREPSTIGADVGNHRLGQHAVREDPERAGATADRRPGRVRVRVPATSANLGPGYDTFGLALGRYDEIELTALDEPGVRVEITGEGEADLPRDEKHLVARAALATFDRLGWRPAGIGLTCRNTIPHARGLGSSAAAIVAGVVGASALAGEPDGPAHQQGLLRMATEIEGHPDNVAACLLGGVTIAWMEDDAARAIRLEPHQDLQAIAFVPSYPSSTSVARGLLPEVVPHRDAAVNAGRAALLTYGLTRDPSVLFPATEDRLHQSYRAASMPASAELVRRLRAAGVPAVISGAGGTVLALAAGHTDELSGYLADLPGAEGVEGVAGDGASMTITPLPVDLSGAIAHPID